MTYSMLEKRYGTALSKKAAQESYKLPSSLLTHLPWVEFNNERMLESQLALKSLLKISQLLFVCAILIVTGWFFLMSFFQMALRDLSVSPLVTPAILFFINLLFFGLAKWRIKRLHKIFLFNATRRQYVKMGDHT